MGGFQQDANKGDIREFNAQLLVHRNFLFNFIYRMTQDRTMAEDLLQETLGKAIKNRGQFQVKSELRTWLAAIAKNEVFGKIRRRKRKLKMLIALREVENQKVESSGVPEDLELLEQIKNGCLYALLNCLPFSQRCVFLLHELNGMSIPHIAGIMKKSENALRVLLCRAKGTIKDFLCGHCEHVSASPHCRCRNMMNFSVSRGFVKKLGSADAVARINKDMGIFKDEIELLKSLPQLESPEISPLAPA